MNTEPGFQIYFIFQLTEYPCNDTFDIFFFLDIPRIFLERKPDKPSRYFWSINAFFFAGKRHKFTTQSTPFRTSLEQLIHVKFMFVSAGIINVYVGSVVGVRIRNNKTEPFRR